MCLIGVALSLRAWPREAPRQSPPQKLAHPQARRVRSRAASRAAAKPPKRAAPAAKRPVAKVAPAAAFQLLASLAAQTRAPNRLVAQRAFNRLLALDRRWTGLEHDRAALALGYFDFSRKRYADATTWFRVARRDPLLARYALYWEGQTALAAGDNHDALALLGNFLSAYPHSVLLEPALGSLALAAIGAKEPDRAIQTLRAYPGTPDSATLLVRLALAEQNAGNLPLAAAGFQRVYNLFPLKLAAHDAADGIARTRAELGARFPEAPVADRIARADILFRHRRWRDARLEWLRLGNALTGVERQRADLRVAECDAHLTRLAGPLEGLTLTDPALDAERWLAIFNLDWDRKDETSMQSAVNHVLALAGHGAPAELADLALFDQGNYFWAHVERDQAVPYYRRLLARRPFGPDAATAHWRIAWTAYLENDPQAAALLREQIENYPDSSFTPDALFWLGRLSQKAGDLAAARAYYEKLSTRFAENYFARLARARLAGIHAEAHGTAILPVLNRIPPVPPALRIESGVPASVERQYERGVALRSVAFDDTAMLEFQAAYRQTKAPRLLVDAALAAQGARHYLTGAALVRQLVPDLESRPFDAVPAAIWRIVYPFPYASLIRAYAARYGEDPMLIASLVRQESGFEPRIVSSAGAIGLAQLEPYTALKWSRKLRLWYSRRRLDDPSYNLRVGGAYFRALVGQFGNVEAALAAYNAGEVKVAAWLQDDRGDDGPAKFVESIPFSQTRHYVQVVLDGAVIYQRLYGDSAASRAASSAVARTAAPGRGVRQKARQRRAR